MSSPDKQKQDLILRNIDTLSFKNKIKASIREKLEMLSKNDFEEGQTKLAKELLINLIKEIGE